MITTCPDSTAAGSLLVFSDDWGRHPSSCQHLVRNLLDRYPVLWVNTIGTRAPRLDLQTMNRVAEKLRQWGSAKFLRTRGAAGGFAALRPQPPVAGGFAALPPQPPTWEMNTLAHCQLTVVNPKMWPWFGSPRDRRINRWLLSRQLTPLIQQLPQPVIGLTTLPITADLPDVLPVDRWVYYCVDDFSQWPGLDGDTLRRMDRDMIRRADSLVAVSETLQTMIEGEGRSASLLTHGVDVNFWNALPGDFMQATQETSHRSSLEDFPGPRVVFWGVIDRRLDLSSLRQLSQDMTAGTILLIGPQQDPDPAILSLRNVRTLPAQPLAALPGIAANADVLIMPYADLPVTRAMQPLKLKEYLATGKSVVVNRLPSTDAWVDCLDVAETPEQFSRLVRERIATGVPEFQRAARARLQQESWSSKADQLRNSFTAQPKARLVNSRELSMIAPRDTDAQNCHVERRPFVLHTRIVTGTGGGPDKTILNSPRYLRQYGIDCACLFMRPPGDPGFAMLEHRAAAADAEIIAVDDRGPLDWKVIRDCIRICRERHVTVWHAHDYKSNALGLLVRQFHPMHLVTTAHGWVRFTSRTPLYYRIDRFCLKRYEQIICVSKDLYDRCTEIGVSSSHLHQIDNAIVLEDYPTAAPTLADKAGFGFGSQQLLIGAVGRLSEEKGFHHLINVVARLLADGHSVGLIIAGEGHLREQLQQQISELDLQDHVRLCGFLKDPRELYRAIDLFVLSSLREGLPNVVLEAMASQRAVVATNCNGIPAIVQHMQNGLLVAVDNEQALFEAVRKCLQSDNLRATLAEAGRRTISDRFCFHQRMKKVVDVYRRLSTTLAGQILNEPSRSGTFNHTIRPTETKYVR